MRNTSVKQKLSGEATPSDVPGGSGGSWPPRSTSATWPQMWGFGASVATDVEIKGTSSRMVLTDTRRSASRCLSYFFVSAKIPTSPGVSP